MVSQCKFLAVIGVILGASLWAPGYSSSVTPTAYSKAMEYFSTRDEVYIRFAQADLAMVSETTRKKIMSESISVDNIDQGKVYAYANRNDFEMFAATGIPYETLIPPCFETTVTMSDYSEYLSTPKKHGAAPAVTAWNVYPTYEAYIAMMAKFQTDYPTLAKVVELGTTLQNRKVLAIKLSKNVTGSSTGKPLYYGCATVHGDEVINYINSLHFIDTILSKYGSDPRFTRLLDSAIFYLVPLYNPDGTYKGGNSTVQSAQRFNSNGVDVNRNYPCPCGQTGNHALYGQYSRQEKEVTAILTLLNTFPFALATDLHSGTETVLWPYSSMPRNPCDVGWYKWVCKRYADQIHISCGNNGYFKGCGGDGMGNLYSELYEVHGGSLDIMAIKRHSRMIPRELTNTKLLPAADILKYWGYEKEATLQYFEVLFTGIQGKVTNSVTKAPILNAKMTEATHDFDSAFVYTDSAGFYVRYIETGSWNFTFSAPGYKPKTVPLAVTDLSKKYPLNVELDPITAVVDSRTIALDGSKVRAVAHGFAFGTTGLGKGAAVAIMNLQGEVVARIAAQDNAREIVWNKTGKTGKSVPAGYYVAALSGSEGSRTLSLMVGK